MSDLSAITVRDETSADVAAICHVVAAAFPGPAEARLVDLLRTDGDLLYSLVAVEDDRVVGHVAFSPMDAPFRALGLGPIAVRPERQGRGIGRRLIEAGLARAGAEGWRAVFLLGIQRSTSGSASALPWPCGSHRRSPARTSWSVPSVTSRCPR